MSAPTRTWKDFAREIAVSVIAAGAVSAASLYFFEVRLENSRDRVAALIASEQRFDAAHNDVVVEFGIYANELFTHNDSAQKAKFLRAVITTQLELFDLRQHMKGDDVPALSEYGDELEQLGKQVSPVRKQDDLGPAFTSIQQMLGAHKRITSAVEKQATVRVFD